MPRKQPIQITPNELVGYRPIPGFSRTGRLPDRPDMTYSVETKGRSARRFYNPAIPVGDPRREIGDSTYYALRRKYRQSGDPELQAAEVQAAQRLRNFQRRKDYQRQQLDKLQAEEMGIPFRQFEANRREQAIYDYLTNPMTSPGDPYYRDTSAGGYLSGLLENLGWRPKGAWWPVGDSDRVMKQFGSMQNAIQWKSQSPIRGVMGYEQGEVA